MNIKKIEKIRESGIFIVDDTAYHSTIQYYDPAIANQTIFMNWNDSPVLYNDELEHELIQARKRIDRGEFDTFDDLFNQ